MHALGEFLALRSSKSSKRPLGCAYSVNQGTLILLKRNLRVRNTSGESRNLLVLNPIPRPLNQLPYLGLRVNLRSCSATTHVKLPSYVPASHGRAKGWGLALWVHHFGFPPCPSTQMNHLFDKKPKKSLKSSRMAILLGSLPISPLGHLASEPTWISPKVSGHSY